MKRFHPCSHLIRRRLYRRLILSLVLLIGALLFTAGTSQAGCVRLRVGPARHHARRPVVRTVVVKRVVHPAPRRVWRAGHWAYRPALHRSVWVSGRWVIVK